MKTLFVNGKVNGSSEFNCTSQDMKNDSRGRQHTDASEQCEQDEHIDGFEKVMIIISVLLFLILNS